MKKNLLLIIIFILTAWVSFSQNASDYAVQLTAIVQPSPPKITLNWPDVSSNSYQVFRKIKTDVSWGAVYSTLPGTAVQFVDSNVAAGISYEYKIVRQATGLSGYGYINSGIETSVDEFNGKIILIVDDTFAVSLSSELMVLQHDLEKEGWLVKRIDVNRSLQVDSVKAKIAFLYQSDPGNTKAVFLIGHVPVPYSGLIAPDGHSDHRGAWPADGYYADMNGGWSDFSVHDSSAADPRNRNLSGDGKFDQSIIPSDLELQIGRVDFSNLPAFADSEVTLLRNYLIRDHEYRSKIFTAVNRAVIDDNFGAFSGEAFAASGFKNFAPLLGDSNVISADYRTTLDSASYIWSYGCGGGSFISCGGIGSTSDFAGDSLQTIFTMLFGSYFGDWDCNNNYMKAALASGTTLTISWSGRPHWVYHHMGLGENIGYDSRISQNNNSLYTGNSGVRGVHVSLLGDPSLKMYMISPPENLAADIDNQNIAHLSWTASADSVLGYNIYRRTDSLTPFVKVNQTIIQGINYVDSCILDSGLYQYLVRAVKLEISPSGSFYNLSQGAADTAISTQDMNVIASFTYSVVNDSLFITANNSINAANYMWTFGDGGTSTDTLPIHVYVSGGNYTITLFAYSSCGVDSLSQYISITTKVNEEFLSDEILIYPNPAEENLTIETLSKWDCASLFSLDMKSVDKYYFNNSLILEINVSDLSPGIYFLTIEGSGGRFVKKVVKE